MTAPLPPIRSRVGLAVAGDNVVRGYSVRDDLVGRTSLSGLVALGVSGRRLSAEECALLDDVAVASAVLDVRVWPIKATRVAGAYGQAPSSLSIGLAVVCGQSMGPLLAGASAKMLLEIEAELRPGEELAAQLRAQIESRIERGERLPGFGAPLRPEDERLVALRKAVEMRGRQQMRYWSLAEALAAAALAARGLQANVVLHIGALLLDLGFDVEQVKTMIVGLMANLLVPVAHEAALEADAQLRRLPDEAVEYAGPAPRLSPRAKERG